MSHIFNRELSRLISRGSFSEVYEVPTDTAGKRRAAKVTKLPVQVGECEIIEEQLSQMVSDHKPLCELDHRNLVKLYDMMKDPKESSLIVLMELVDGETLEKRISITGALREINIREFSNDICCALKYLHEHDPSVLHRNINSKTVLITRDNVIKLIDYGISIRLLDDASRHQTGCPRGEPQFMAPELCQSNQSDQSGKAVFEYSRGSDIWAFGCVVFHMATGTRPFAKCKNMMAIVRKVCAAEPPALPDTCSGALRRFYAGCVVRERRGRSSAEQLLGHDFLTGRRQ